VRNPLYVGTLVTALGVAVAAWEPWLFVLLTAAFALVYLPVIELEEQHLRSLFPEYEAWAARVPMIVPRVTAGPSEAPAKFRWALYVRNQEYQALIGLVAGVAWLGWRAGLLPFLAPW
jgi:hypothetical protein